MGSKLDTVTFNDRDLDATIKQLWSKKNKNTGLLILDEAIALATQEANSAAGASQNDDAGCANTISNNNANYQDTINLWKDSGSKNLNALTGSIRSQGYPKPHPGKATCEYTLPNQDPNLTVEITTTRMALDCRNRAHVVIKTIGTKDKPIKLCRLKRPVTFMNNKGFVVNFNTNLRGNYANKKFPHFKLDFRYIDGTHMCKQDSHNTIPAGGKKKLMFSTPNWPRPYPANSQCRFYLEPANAGYLISLDFIRGIRSEKKVPCGPNTDNLIIFEAENCSDGVLMQAQIWGSLCGFNPKRQRFNFDTRVGLCVVWLADNDKNKNRGAVFSASQQKIKN